MSSRISSLLNKYVSKNSWAFRIFIAVACIVIVSAIFLINYSLAPKNFEYNTTVTIKENSGLNSIADTLVENKIIKSAFLYKSFAVLMGGYKKVKAGDYLFDRPESLVKVVYRTVNGVQGLEKIKIFIPEGSDSKVITKILTRRLKGFDDKKFYELAKQNEGYLFPDTYFFYQNVKPEKVIDTMLENFENKVQISDVDLQKINKRFEEIMIMASIVEREATSTKDRQIIAGILWKRISKGMALQVDPPFYYILGKDSSQITLADLKMNSPYNLYKNKGLPPTPISNPGLDSIMATINPIETKYYFFLSGSDGVIRYATTHEGHLVNKDKYM